MIGNIFITHTRKRKMNIETQKKKGDCKLNPPSVLVAFLHLKKMHIKLMLIYCISLFVPNVYLMFLYLKFILKYKMYNYINGHSNALMVRENVINFSNFSPITYFLLLKMKIKCFIRIIILSTISFIFRTDLLFPCFRTLMQVLCKFL